MSAIPAPVPRRASTPEPTTRPALRVVRPPRRRVGYALLVIVCGWLLAVGVGAVLWFNTTMAADAFERHELEVELADLAEQRAIVLERINDHESPASLADRARDLGMLPGTHITYVRLSDGSTIGQPVAAGEESEEVNQESEWAGEESGEESLSQPPEAEL